MCKDRKHPVLFPLEELQGHATIAVVKIDVGMALVSSLGLAWASLARCRCSKPRIAPTRTT